MGDSGALWRKAPDCLCSRLEDHARDDLIQSQRPISWIVGSAYFVWVSLDKDSFCILQLLSFHYIIQMILLSLRSFTRWCNLPSRARFTGYLDRWLGSSSQGDKGEAYRSNLWHSYLVNLVYGWVSFPMEVPLIFFGTIISIYVHTCKRFCSSSFNYFGIRRKC